MATIGGFLMAMGGVMILGSTLMAQDTVQGERRSTAVAILGLCIVVIGGILKFAIA